MTKWLAGGDPFVRGIAPGAPFPWIPFSMIISFFFLGIDDPVDEVTWWQAGHRLGFPPLLTDLAIKLHSINASSAGLERHLSTMRITYGMLRTRMGVEKARKVSFLTRQYNLNK